MKRRFAPPLCALLATTSPIAAETLSYSYDVHGRLTNVARSGGHHAGVATRYGYDPADNRTNVWQGAGTPPGAPAARAPAFSISDASVDEGGELVFIVTRHGSFAQPAGGYTVSFTVGGGSATAGSDFTVPASNTVSFSADDYQKPIRVQTTHDTTPEANETLSVSFLGVNGSATFTDSTALGTIVNNDSSVQAPVTASDFANTGLCDGGFLINVAANDEDPGGNYPLYVNGIVSQSGGYALFEGPWIYFTPTAVGDATIVYRIQNTLGATANGTLHVEVTGQAPCQ